MIVVNTAEAMKLTLNPASESERKAQELYILLNTIQGECPLYRDFGIDGRYLHMPINAAQTAVTLSVMEGLKKYMPDVKLEDIHFKDDPNNVMVGILNAVVEVSDYD